MPIAFPKVVREYIVTMSSYTGVFWQRGRAVGVIVKLPKNVPILSMDVSFGTFYRDASLIWHIPLHVQARNTPLSFDVDCLVNPPSLASMSVITALLSTEQVEVYFVSLERTYLGIHQLPLSLKETSVAGCTCSWSLATSKAGGTTRKTGSTIPSSCSTRATYAFSVSCLISIS